LNGLGVILLLTMTMMMTVQPREDETKATAQPHAETQKEFLHVIFIISKLVLPELAVPQQMPLAAGASASRR